MKQILKILFTFLILSFIFTGFSCSKKNHGYNYAATPRHGATSYDPVATKHQPVRKKYIINGKRKTILGHEKPISN